MARPERKAFTYADLARGIPARTVRDLQREKLLSAADAAMIIPPSSWFLAPSGLMISPPSQAHHSFTSRTPCSTSTSEKRITVQDWSVRSRGLS